MFNLNADILRYSYVTQCIDDLEGKAPHNRIYLFIKRVLRDDYVLPLKRIQ